MDHIDAAAPSEENFSGGSLLANLDPPSHEFLFSFGVRRKFVAGTTLMREGDFTDSVLIILSGWVRVFITGPEGQVILIALRGPGDVLGDAAAVSGWARTATVETLQSVTAIQMRGEKFLECLTAQPAISVALLKSVYIRERDSEMARIDFALSDVAQRVAGLLIRLAEMRGKRDEDDIIVDVTLTQQDVANSVGASRRAVARAMAVLRDRGFVSTGRGRFTIHSLETLKHFAR